MVANLIQKKDFTNHSTIFGPRSFMAVIHNDEERKVIHFLDRFLKQAERNKYKRGDLETISVSRRMYDGKAFLYWMEAKSILGRKLDALNIECDIKEIANGDDEDLFGFIQKNKRGDIIRSLTFRPECYFSTPAK